MQTAKKLTTILPTLMLMLQGIGEFGALYAEAIGEEPGEETASEVLVETPEPVDTAEPAEKEVLEETQENPAKTSENPGSLMR